MSASYHVQAVKVSKTEITLRATIINPEEPDFYKAPSFALMLLYDSTLGWKHEKSELRKAILPEQMLNPKWLAQESSKYISRIEISGWRNYPASPEQDFSGSSLDSLPHATIQIQVSSPAWIAHLEAGEEWESAAFDIQGYL